MRDVLGERCNAELIVVLKEVREALPVSLIVVELGCAHACSGNGLTSMGLHGQVLPGQSALRAGPRLLRV